MMFRRRSLLRCLLPLLLSDCSYGWITSTRSSLRRRPPHWVSRIPRQANDPRDDGSISLDAVNGNDEPIPKQESLSDRLLRKRCPDYPSFAASSTGAKKQFRRARRLQQKKLKLLISQQSSSSSSSSASTDDNNDGDHNDSPSWEVSPKVLESLPMEPGLFLNIANAARRTRLLTDRCYASQAPFEAANLRAPPTLVDLDRPRPAKLETFWISIPSRFLTFLVAFLLFPYLMSALNQGIASSVEPEQLGTIASDFAPGVSILYGTFVSLTLSVLYNRQQNLQDDIALEVSLLMYLTRSLLRLVGRDDDDDRQACLWAGQCVADQVRTLVRGSRGMELTLLMYSDPYARLMELVDDKERRIMEERGGEVGGYGGLLAVCRDTLREIVKARSKRLSDEALALPPTHFFVLTALTLLVLMGYCVSVLPTIAVRDAPPLESSLLFGILCSVYVFFYNFASDLNNPFEGVYQIRRSSAASQLLEIKWLLVNHPVLRGQVDFEEFLEDVDGDDEMIAIPGLGEMWFKKADQ